MKRLICIILMLIMAVSSIAATVPKKARVEECNKLIESLSDEVTLENLENVALAGMKWAELYPEDRKLVNTKKLDEIEQKMCNHAPYPFFFAKELMKQESGKIPFTIHGDVVCHVGVKDDGTKSHFFEFVSSSKDWRQSFLIFGAEGLDMAFINPTTVKNYYSTAQYKYCTEVGLIDAKNDYFFVISGERIANAIGCDYMQ